MSEESAEQAVLVERRDRVMVITLNRPEARNSLSDTLSPALRDVLPKLAEDPPSAETLRRTEDLCAKIRRNFLQAELRSYRVMKETLSG